MVVSVCLLKILESREFMSLLHYPELPKEATANFGESWSLTPPERPQLTEGSPRADNTRQVPSRRKPGTRQSILIGEQRTRLEQKQE